MAKRQFLPIDAYVWEGECLLPNEWVERFGISEHEVSQLIQDGALKPIQNDRGRSYRLDLVGLLFTKERAFASLPKIFRGKIDATVIGDILACMRTYTGRMSRRIRHAEASERLSVHDADAKLIDAFLSLMDWTANHGFHSEDLEALIDEPSDIEWAVTFDRSVPLHIKRSVVFSELLGRHANYRYGKLAFLQAKALLTMHAALAPISHIWLTPHDQMLEVSSDILGGNSQIDSESILELDELIDFVGSCNRDHDRQLATLLLEWLLGSRRKADSPRLYGTTAFQYVWEDICISMTAGIGDLVSHKSLASQPAYILNTSSVQTDGQRPDIVRVSCGNVYILDAKWYDVGRGDKPGAPDIIKQLCYQLSVGEEHAVACNAFLCPTSHDQNNVASLGAAQMMRDGDIDHRFPSVTLIGIPWKIAIAAYARSNDGREMQEQLRGVLGVGEKSEV